MSKASVHKYFELVANDSSQAQAIGAGVESADEFIAQAVAAAAKKGLEFSPQEVADYLDGAMTPKADGELSDQQLEEVAGGYMHSPSLSQMMAQLRQRTLRWKKAHLRGGGGG
jgi:hypothetical protein